MHCERCHGIGRVPERPTGSVLGTGSRKCPNCYRFDTAAYMVKTLRDAAEHIIGHVLLRLWPRGACRFDYHTWVGEPTREKCAHCSATVWNTERRKR